MKLVVRLLLIAACLIAAPANSYWQSRQQVTSDQDTPAADLNFAAGTVAGGCSSFTDCLTISRASSKTDLLPSSVSGFAYNTFLSNVLAITPGSGLLIEEGRTNVLLNSTIPVTQTTASLATGTYTLWVNGSGSATSSAGSATITGAGAATNGTPNVFVVTVAGTVTIAVTGPLSAFQCELGAFGTSLIVTAGSTATRAADNIVAAGMLLSIMQGAAYSVVAAVNGTPNVAATPRFIGVNGGSNQTSLSYQSGTQVLTYNGAVSTLLATLGSGSSAGLVKAAAAFSGTGRSLVANNGTLTTDATVNPTVINAAIGSVNGSGAFVDGYMQRLSVWNSRLPDATLKALTQ